MSAPRIASSILLSLALACASDEPSDAPDDGTGATSSAEGSDVALDDDTTDVDDGSGADPSTADGGATGTTGATAADDGTSVADNGDSVDTTDAGTTTGDDILFADDFERADTQAGLDNGWIVNVQGGMPPSAFHIDANRAFPFFGEVFQKPLFHASPSAFRPELFDQDRIRVSADLVTVGGSYDGLVVLFARSQVTSNEIVDTYWCGFLAAAKKLYIGKVTDGVLDAIEISGPDILPLPPDSTSRLSFTIDGDQLTCEISGAVNHVITGSDTAFESGYFGMMGGKPEQNTVLFDDFVLETL